MFDVEQVAGRVVEGLRMPASMSGAMRERAKARARSYSTAAGTLAFEATCLRAEEKLANPARALALADQNGTRPVNAHLGHLKRFAKAKHIEGVLG